jgi:hypothetical protein
VPSFHLHHWNKPPHLTTDTDHKVKWGRRGSSIYLLQSHPKPTTPPLMWMWKYVERRVHNECIYVKRKSCTDNLHMDNQEFTVVV